MINRLKRWNYSIFFYFNHVFLIIFKSSSNSTIIVEHDRKIFFKIYKVKHLSKVILLANIKDDNYLFEGGIMEEKQSYTIAEIQKQVDDYIQQFEEGYFSPLSLMARLSEESGELAREINDKYGEKPKKDTEEEGSIAEELGDLLFVITCISNSLQIDLNEAYKQTMEKFATRDKNRWTRK